MAANCIRQGRRLVSDVGCTRRTIPRKDDQTAEIETSGGLIGMNTKDRIPRVSVDEQTIINYILPTLNNTELAFKMASRANPPGPNDLYIRQYQQLFQSGQFLEAAQFPKSRSSTLPARWRRRATPLDELVYGDGKEGKVFTSFEPKVCAFEHGWSRFVLIMGPSDAKSIVVRSLEDQSAQVRPRWSCK